MELLEGTTKQQKLGLAETLPDLVYFSSDSERETDVVFEITCMHIMSYYVKIFVCVMVYVRYHIVNDSMCKKTN